MTASYRQPLKQLIEAFEGSRFDVLEVESGETHILLRRGRQPSAEAAILDGLSAGSPLPVRPPHARSGTHRPSTAVPSTPSAPALGSDLSSPRVGRFFPPLDNAGQPALGPGSRLEMGQVYAIIESMDLRYEIRAEREGTVDRFLVEPGAAVEYGQPLLRLLP